MDIFGMLGLFGGLAMFLYGMDLMGKSLERQAGNRLQSILEKLTASPAKGFLLGLLVTAVIQSSSATTVMVVGFVNSGIMKLQQACGVIMGANVGTTVTAWILSLTGLEGSSFLVRLCKPSTFTPVLALVGIIMYMFLKRDKFKNIGTTLLGFAILMFGMEAMSDAVKPLADVPAFTNLFTLFSNPILGVLTGALLTAIIQSSSAAVGILQALSATGAVTYSSAIPIIMGQNIGTCVTALISSVGANRNARRTAIIHLYFNIIGVVVFLTLYMLIDAVFSLPFTALPVNELGIAVVHTCFNLLATAAMLPFTRQLERLACLTIKESEKKDDIETLDERLLGTPAVAVDQCHRVSRDMARAAKQALSDSLVLMDQFNLRIADSIHVMEDRLDRYEDRLGSYLVKLSASELSAPDARRASMLLHMIGDFERIGDHALNIVEVAEELYEKSLSFSSGAQSELQVLTAAIREILDLTFGAFEHNNLSLARQVEPLEQVIDDLTKSLKSRHIERLQDGVCTIQMGFVLADFTNNCERVADHCSNIAAALIENAEGSFDLHDYTGHVVTSASFRELYTGYRQKYSLLPTLQEN